MCKRYTSSDNRELAQFSSIQRLTAQCIIHICTQLVNQLSILAIQNISYHTKLKTTIIIIKTIQSAESSLDYIVLTLEQCHVNDKMSCMQQHEIIKFHSTLQLKINNKINRMQLPKHLFDCAKPAQWDNITLKLLNHLIIFYQVCSTGS